MASTTLKRRKLDLNMHEGWSAFVFLSLALIIVTWSINEAGYDESLKHLIFVTLGALAASLFLSKSRFPWFLAHASSLVYGIAWNAYVISYQLPDTFTPRDRLLELGYRIGAWFQVQYIRWRAVRGEFTGFGCRVAFDRGQRGSVSADRPWPAGGGTASSFECRLPHGGPSTEEGWQILSDPPLGRNPP